MAAKRIQTEPTPACARSWNAMKGVSVQAGAGHRGKGAEVGPARSLGGELRGDGLRGQHPDHLADHEDDDHRRDDRDGARREQGQEGKAYQQRCCREALSGWDASRRARQAQLAEHHEEGADDHQ